MFLRYFILIAIVISLVNSRNARSERSFQIGRTENAFLKDGLPFRFISGSMHYYRTHPDLWRDRLRKLRMSGCNTVQTYVEWASHQLDGETETTFEASVDIFRFIEIAQEEDLLVIFRPGPYIDAERDMGGLPYWLMREKPDMVLRSTDAEYMKYVTQWFNILLPKVRPYLYENGGPIIMVQIENEYGSLSCEKTYTSSLRNLLRAQLGSEVLLYTTDGAFEGHVGCGDVEGAYATVDFGPGVNVEEKFKSQRAFEPQGPLVNSEFYTGWIDYWGMQHSKTDAKTIVKTLDEMLVMNASVNFYMFHGGTSFEMTSGSNLTPQFKSCPTSYDYDSPISEAGDPTEKYFTLRDTIAKYVEIPEGDVPPASQKGNYGQVPVTFIASVLDLEKTLLSSYHQHPPTFESISVRNGIVVYSTELPMDVPTPAQLFMPELHDRGYVYLDDEFIGTVLRETEEYNIPITGNKGQMISVVVESQGRVCSGYYLNDIKGITTDVYLNSEILTDWKVTPLLMTNAITLREAIENIPINNENENEAMSFYEGEFYVEGEPLDTFLKVDGWGKGYAWINDFMLGRYWPEEGPQITLYVPSPVLVPGKNKIRLLELEKTPCTDSKDCVVSFVEEHQVDGPVGQK